MRPTTQASLVYIGVTWKLTVWSGPGYARWSAVPQGSTLGFLGGLAPSCAEAMAAAARQVYQYTTGGNEP